MKKFLVTISVASVISGAAYAQSNVRLSGSMYAGVGTGSPDVGSSTTALAAPSSFMFSGVEDVGGGNKIIFKMESSIKGSTGALGTPNVLFDKQAFLGAQGPWGTLRFGRVYTPGFTSLALVADSTATETLIQSYSVAEAQGVRKNNGIIYNSVGFNPLNYARSGFYVTAAYYTAETGVSDKSSYGLLAGYGKGPAVVELSNHHANDGIGKASVDTNNILLAASYEFSVARAHFGYAVNKSENATTGAITKDNTDLLLGLVIPVGPGALKVSYVTKNDKMAANKDARMYGAAYYYLLSKRTSIVAAIGKLNNHNGAGRSLNSSYLGFAGATTGYTLGMQHSF